METRPTETDALVVSDVCVQGEGEEVNEEVGEEMEREEEDDEGEEYDEVEDDEEETYEGVKTDNTPTQDIVLCKKTTHTEASEGAVPAHRQHAGE